MYTHDFSCRSVGFDRRWSAAVNGRVGARDGIVSLCLYDEEPDYIYLRVTARDAREIGAALIDASLRADDDENKTELGNYLIARSKAEAKAEVA